MVAIRLPPFFKEQPRAQAPDPALIIFPLFIGNENFGFLMVYEASEGFEVREKKFEIIKGVRSNCRSPFRMSI
jgi:GAF domain-containing protein